MGLEDRVGALLEEALGDGVHLVEAHLAFWVAQALALVPGGLDLEASWDPGLLWAVAGAPRPTWPAATFLIPP
ncbi:hypothetical protein E2562_036000 [Oryza meyeriana var. granulata]|uniref:Uncharacterized protein n=1 Tax=Oryza meyeriana var. granulata TaxID=110450 RepID=A0A6G1ET10_9ORYZ|nr:hypothetical protein E2562_036000 [Oryza meyeriana var. granulata]